MDVGGADGLGIYFSNNENIDIEDTSFHTYDEDINTYNNNLYPHRINESGVYYKAQDTIKNHTFKPYHNYSWDSAHLSVWPSFNGAVDSQVRTHWTHTWSSAKISGVSISTSGISVSISNSSKSQGYATLSYN